MRRIVAGTWRKSLTSVKARAVQIAAGPSAPAVRAAQWNSHCVSTVLYPSQTALPGPQEARILASCARDVFRTNGWAPWWMATAPGLIWGVSGGPRCPLAAAAAAGALATLRGEGWGPAEAKLAQRNELLAIVAVAEGRAEGDDGDRAEIADPATVQAAVRQ